MSYSTTAADVVADQPEILRLCAATLGGRSASVDRFRWYYLENPFGRGRAWLLRNGADGRFVGTVGLGRRRLRAGERIIEAGIASDFGVETAHRSLRPALMLQRAVCKTTEDDLEVVYGMPNQRALAVVTRAGYVQIGAMRRLVKVLRSEPYLKRRFAGGAASLVPTTVLDRVMAYVSRERWRPVPKGLVVEPIAAFDGRFDDLWARARSSCRIMGERTAAFLRWRYAACPVREYRAIGLSSAHDGQLLGYIVYYAVGEDIHVADLLAEPGERLLGALLGGFLRAMRQTRSASVWVSFLAPPPMARVFEAYGFRRWGADQPVFAYLRKGSFAEAEGRRPEAWYLMPGDEE